MSIQETGLVWVSDGTLVILTNVLWILRVTPGKLGHNYIPPNHFQFVIQQSKLPMMLYSLRYWHYHKVKSTTYLWCTYICSGMSTKHTNLMVPILASGLRLTHGIVTSFLKHGQLPCPHYHTSSDTLKYTPMKYLYIITSSTDTSLKLYSSFLRQKNELYLSVSKNEDIKG